MHPRPTEQGLRRDMIFADVERPGALAISAGGTAVLRLTDW
jgi:hypothetical protein